MNTNALKRFLSKIYVDLAGCWIWKNSKRTWSKKRFDGGYGAFWADGKVHRAHKWVYEKLVGPVPKGKFLLHSCDTRSCVNIWHTYPDTHLQNMKDMVRKGRSSRAV